MGQHPVQYCHLTFAELARVIKIAELKQSFHDPFLCISFSDTHGVGSCNPAMRGYNSATTCIGKIVA